MIGQARPHEAVPMIALSESLDTSALEMRTLSLRGREEVTEVWVAAA